MAISPRTVYCLFDTAFGTSGIAWTEHGIRRFLLPERNRAAVGRKMKKLGAIEGEPPPAIKEVIGEARRYFGGERVNFRHIVLDLSHRAGLELRIYDALRVVPWGEMVTYGELAKRTGTDAQTVGKTMGRNPVPLIIPCHRVVATGGIGGFSGPGGVHSKGRMLALEGVSATSDTPLLPGLLTSHP